MKASRQILKRGVNEECHQFTPTSIDLKEGLGTISATPSPSLLKYDEP